MTTDLTQLSVAALATGFRTKAFSPVEVTKAVLDRIDLLQSRFNAFRAVDAQAALEQARASEARWSRGETLGPLDGAPVGLKDLLHVRGFSTRKGSLATQDAVQKEDSPVAARLREGGAVIIGKTQTAEFGQRALTETRLAGVTPNAWDPQYASGGSSGGAGVAAALGLGPLQIGTDGGGSIRNPAAANGVFGFKPTFGRVANYPPNGTLFHIGPITRTVRDAALLLQGIAKPDARDWTSLPSEGVDWTANLDSGVKGLRIGYSRTFGYISVDPAIVAVVDRAVARLAELGAVVEEVDPGFHDPQAILEAINAERAIRIHAEIGDAGLELLDPAIRERLERFERFSLRQVVAANERRHELGVTMRQFHQRYDLLASPVQSAPTPRVGSAPQTPFASPFNLTQQPAASIPAGFDANGLPIALQLVGPQYGDAIVLRASRAFEVAQPFPTRHIDSLQKL
jgi:aspartyl-tRNA(Asn)/glutamyl-tRNA(Gln) amidotransferase subunit A